MEKSVTDFMGQLPIFAGLEAQELAELAQACQLKRLKRGETLFSAGYPAKNIYIILAGSAKLVRSNPDGKERIVHLLLKGEMFGAAVAMQGSYYPVTAISLEQTAVMEIAAPAFQTVFLRHPKVGQILVGQMGQRIQQAHNDRINSFDAVDKRIAAFLVELLERIQALYGKTSRIAVPLTRQDIADRVGTTVETVIRTFSQWSKEGLIATQDKYIEIPSTGALKEAVGLEIPV